MRDRVRYLDQALERILEVSNALPQLVVDIQNASVDPSRGGGSETGYRDPTGSHATSGESDFDDLKRLDDLVIRVSLAAGALHDLATSYNRPETAPVSFCSSCDRDGGYREPVTLRPSGTARRAGLCEWCGAFQAEYGRLPSPALLHAHHEGRRITAAMVERYGRTA